MQRRDSLKGLPGVRVIVETFSSAAEGAGFDHRTFQTDVELKLRMAGIIATEDIFFPMLYLNVNALHRERDRNGAYNTSLELVQRVRLESQLHSDRERSSEEASATVAATTWSTESVGVGSVTDARAAVRDLVDKFINDWLAVNPLRDAPVNPGGT